MIEIDLNIMSAPQSYYLAQGISKDLNFSTGLPALFERMYGVKEKIEEFYKKPDEDKREYLKDMAIGGRYKG